jgi:sialate O-acetylesterase
MRRLLIILLLLGNTPLLAQVKLARLFSDHVVLQRQKPIPVWGWAKPGEKVKITLASQKLEIKADASGKWLVTFLPLEAGGPHQLKVTAKSGSATATDVLIGEVWLCSGQSNMEWSVAASNNFAEEKKNAEFPQIRHFRVEHEVSLTPEKDLSKGEWKVASSESIGGFTAIGFFFARELYQKLGIPVGILHSSWGGSQIEGWISKEAMMTHPELKLNAQKLPATWPEADEIMDRRLRKQLFGDAEVKPTMDDENKYPEMNFANLKGIKSNDPVGQLDWKGLMGFRGQVYFARQIDVPGDMIGKQTSLSLAENDGSVQVFINGKLISDEVINGPRKLTIPAGTWKEGKNQLLLKLGNMVKHPWFGPGLLGKSTDLYLEEGGQKINLATNWLLIPSFATKHEYAHLMNNLATIIYNAMIVPLVPFGIRGSLWYQGESNAGRAYQYRDAFPLMIKNWRQVWGEPGKPDDFSFYWVQLSSFGGDASSNKGSGWAELREAQNMTLALPKTGMAVTTDIGNPKDIHPTNKQDVAHRLAVNALKFDYGQDIPYSSPLYDQVWMDGNKAVVSFKFAENGLSVKDKYGYLKGFEIAGDDKVFCYAQAEISGNTVIVSHPKVLKPVAVRYAWTDAPEDANLYNNEGFPASPFRTDNWPGITLNKKFE